MNAFQCVIALPVQTILQWSARWLDAFGLFVGYSFVALGIKPGQASVDLDRLGGQIRKNVAHARINVAASSEKDRA